MTSFLRQIKFEIRNIIKSKFLLIIGILLIAAGIAIPIINLIASRNTQTDFDGPRPMPMMDIAVDVKPGMRMPIYPDMDQESLTIDGVTILSSNPFYWQISSFIQEKEYMEKDKGRFSSSEALDLTLSLMDAEIEFYVGFAKHITDHSDYRTDLAYRSQESMYDKFILENADVSEDALLEALNQRRGMDPEILRKKYLEISPEERLAALDKAEEELESLFSIMENNDFPKYVDLRIQQEYKMISDLNEQIATQEQEIINNPSQEEIINSMIEDLKRSIALIEENTIPILQFRLEKNIIPGENIWQNTALMDIEQNRHQLTYTKIISEEEFNKEIWLVQQYKTYTKYVEDMQNQIDAMNNAIIIADRSIQADKPDMKYVYDGSRNRTIRFLNYSIFAALFAALLGGWIMASEFQQGTIRLLMIRPKTRTKILMAKFLSALIVSLGIYVVGSLLNVITNGFCFGFTDYAFPNYTVSGEIGFFAYYLPRMLACTIPIIFIYAVAFMLSVIVKNVAVSIAVPIAGFIGSTIFAEILAYTRAANWIAYTPIPYMQLSIFFTQNINSLGMPRRGMPLNLTYGIMLLLALSVLCVVLSLFVFRKRDIVN